jgi:pimeloyl-ACP methyl ester carboxylesterase/predicted glycosyltransferase
VKRAAEPASTGLVDGRLHYEVFGAGERTIVLLPTWNIIDSRCWKMQVPYLAQHHRVVTFDPRGNGRSYRPATGYTLDDHCADVIAVLDAQCDGPVTLVGYSMAANHVAKIAAEHPQRTERVVMIAPAINSTPKDAAFWIERVEYEGWQKYNAHYWLKDYRQFCEFFFAQLFSEPHSTKPFEDAIAWALDANPELLVQGEREYDRAPVDALLERIRAPTLIIHGTDDQIIPFSNSEAIARRIPDARLVGLDGSGHGPQLRDPVKVNLLVDDFVGVRRPSRRISRAMHRRRPRALYISSPIGLGHAQRDLAIVRAMREQRPELEVVWLAQHPVTRFLEAAGETIHPASARLANESAHFESEMCEHDLHCFQAWRNMDEILLANFMLFHDIVRDDHYDLWLGDESWEVDYYLHENPNLKAAPYVFMTDFVGWLPIDERGDEARIAADYNHENIKHIERYPFVRDRALFIGNPTDIVPRTFGPALPGMPDWIPKHFAFPGYVLPFDPADLRDTERLRHELGLPVASPLIVAAVGGSGVGIHLLRRIAAAFRELRKDVPEARLLAVCGPRIAPAELEPVEGMTVVGYVHDLFRVLACCDLAVVQGGLTTTMELVANRRPFIYIPLQNHFEQNFHVVHRLRQYGAPEPTLYEHATASHLAALMRERLGKPVDYRPVETGCAAVAASSILSLL